MNHFLLFKYSSYLYLQSSCLVYRPQPPSFLENSVSTRSDKDITKFAYYENGYQ